MAPKTPRKGTRTSSRLAGKDSSPASSQTSPATNNTTVDDGDNSARKRKAEASASPADRSEKKPKPEQKTLEEIVGDGSGIDITTTTKKENTQDKPEPTSSHEEQKESVPSAGNVGNDQHSSTNGETVDEKKADHAHDDASKNSTSGAVEESSKRENALPSNVLEKGILYFFSRPRVGIDDPKSVQDIARSYIVLRPLPDGAKLGDGPIDDLKNNRLIALPKKMLPKSHTDRFMVFVEKHGVAIATLKDEFMASSTYQTQTVGERTSPAVTPIAEGVYAITTTGRESHLAYMLTIPSDLGEVQKSLGLADKGSFVLSTKNPTIKGPSSAQLDTPAEFSKDIIDDFRGRSWMPSEPKHLDFDKAQFLLIGEAQGDLGKAVQAEEKDEQSEEKHTPEEELELLEHEDLKRVESLRGDDSIFDDLGLSKKEYPQVPTTW